MKKIYIAVAGKTISVDAPTVPKFGPLAEEVVDKLREAVGGRQRLGGVAIELSCDGRETIPHTIKTNPGEQASGLMAPLSRMF